MAELLKALTPRLADSQSNLKPLAASALAEIASSVGPEAATKVRLSSECLGRFEACMFSRVTKFGCSFAIAAIFCLRFMLSCSSRYVQHTPHATPHTLVVRVYHTVLKR